MKNKKLLIEGVKKSWAKNLGIPKINPSTSLKDFDLVKQVADFFAAGLYYYFIINFETFQVETVSKSIEDFYGFKTEGLTLETMLTAFDEEDLKLMQEKEQIAFDFLFNKIPLEDIPEYKVSYLVKTKTLKGEKKIILHQAKAIEISPQGKLIRVMGIHTDITYMNPKLDNKISFISNSKQSFYSFEVDQYLPLQSKFNFSDREVHIIQNIALGLTEQEIGKKLFISPLTVKTHKKNIFLKAKVKNSAELVALCIREDII